MMHHMNDCKENITKKSPLCLLEIEKRGDFFKVNLGHDTTKLELHYD